jgi:hypothetical protein
MAGAAVQIIPSDTGAFAIAIRKPVGSHPFPC